MAEAIELPESDESVRISAALVTAQGVPFLCDVVLDSFPEQCGTPSIALTGADLDSLDLDTVEGEMSGAVDIVVVIHDGVAEFVRDSE
ncbi:MAG: hypothetical protein QM677_01240 [Microbacterium sp.]